MGQTFWKCGTESCSDDHIYRFKGLCRNCTTYAEGKVSEPVQRVRCTEAGSQYVAPEPVVYANRPITRQEQIEMSRQHKMEKKHKNALRRAKKMLRDEMIPDEHREALTELLGESIGESVHVHDENCNHEEE